MNLGSNQDDSLAWQDHLLVTLKELVGRLDICQCWLLCLVRPIATRLTLLRDGVHTTVAKHSYCYLRMISQD